MPTIIETSIMDWLKEEWVLAGHKLTGAFEESLEAMTEREGERISIKITGYVYGIFMSKGVKAEEIKYPFAKARINGLRNYVKLRMGISDEREATGIAYAIATKHSIEGMPIRNNKLGTQFIDAVREKHINDIEDQVADYYNILIDKSWQSQV